MAQELVHEKRQALLKAGRNSDNNDRGVLPVNNEWRNKFEAALTERNPALQSLRIVEAFEAIVQRIEELEEMGASNGESRRLKDAIEELKRLRDFTLDRPA